MHHSKIETQYQLYAMYGAIKEDTKEGRMKERGNNNGTNKCYYNM
jgi:hypothetical protein